MIETLTIKVVNATDRNKEGLEYNGKYGKFWRVGILVEEYDDRWLNGFSNKEPNWREGDKIELDIKEEETEQYGKQLKFRIPKKEDIEVAKKDDEIAKLKAELDKKEDTTEEISKEDEAIIDDF